MASYPVPTTEPSVDSSLRRVQVLRPGLTAAAGSGSTPSRDQGPVGDRTRCARGRADIAYRGMTDRLAQVGELPTALLMGALGVVMLADAVPLLGVLVPGDVAILAAVGVGRPATGLATVAAVVAGCLAGWSLSFLAGRRYGDRLRHSRVGGWIGESRWAAAEVILRRGGGRMVLVAPFLPVFNALLPLAAGGLRMSYRRFAACAALGAAAWAGLYVALGTAVPGAGRAAARGAEPDAGDHGGRPAARRPGAAGHPAPAPRGWPRLRPT